MGIKLIYEKLNLNNFVVIFFIVVSVFYAFSLPINYFQTTRFFNQNAAVKVIEFVNTSNENIVIYHGGVWTIGSYINEPLHMEKKGLNFSGSGVSNHPIPIFNKDSLYVPCTKYKTTGHCKDILKNFLNSHNSKIYYLAAIHRVSKRTSEPRYSTPYFYNPTSDSIIEPLPIISDSKPRYQAFTWKEYIQGRIDDNYKDLGQDDIQISNFKINHHPA